MFAVNLEGIRCEALAGLRLLVSVSVSVATSGANQVDTEIPPRLHEEPGINVACIDNVLVR